MEMEIGGGEGLLARELSECHLLWEGRVLELLPGNPLTKEHGKGRGRSAYVDGLW